MSPAAVQVVLFGAGGHSRVVADIARCSNREVVARVDESRPSAAVEALAVFEEPLRAAQLHPTASWCVCIGDNDARQLVVARLMAALPGVRFVTLVHPSAVVAADVDIGEGSVVMAGAVLNPGTRIGRHCIVNTGACLDHDNVLDDFASVAPGVTTGGNVHIGTAAALCIGACVKHRVSIGARAVIGAGAVVLTNVPESCVAFGTPCRVVRSRGPADRYL